MILWRVINWHLIARQLSARTHTGAVKAEKNAERDKEFVQSVESEIFPNSSLLASVPELIFEAN